MYLFHNTAAAALPGSAGWTSNRRKWTGIVGANKVWDGRSTRFTMPNPDQPSTWIRCTVHLEAASWRGGETGRPPFEQLAELQAARGWSCTGGRRGGLWTRRAAITTGGRQRLIGRRDRSARHQRRLRRGIRRTSARSGRSAERPPLCICTRARQLANRFAWEVEGALPALNLAVHLRHAYAYCGHGHQPPRAHVLPA
jgi:hypothetical protein